MTYCNLMSIVDGARGSPEADQAHIESGKQFLNSGDRPRAIEVPAHTLTKVLHRHNVGSIDLLSLDVEGFEAPALRGLDFKAFSPKWILVEANDAQAIDEILGRWYHFVATLSHHDRLYRLK